MLLLVPLRGRHYTIIMKISNAAYCAKCLRQAGLHCAEGLNYRDGSIESCEVSKVLLLRLRLRKWEIGELGDHAFELADLVLQSLSRLPLLPQFAL